MTPQVPRSSVRPSRARRLGPGPTPYDVAPDVDAVWADAFVTELRLSDVPGRRIGDALVEVGSHCAESGEGAGEAFGDPVEYARSLDLPRVPDLGTVSSGFLMPYVVQAVGLLLVTDAVRAVRSGAAVDVTTGHLVATVLALVGPWALSRWASRVLRLVVEHAVRAWLALVAHVGLLLGVFVLLRDVVVQVPGPVALAGCTVALVGGAVWAVTAVRGDVGADDPVSATVGPVRGAGTRGSSTARYAPALMMPVAAVAFVGLGLLIGS